MPMPYTLTRGPILTLLENALNPKTTAEVATRDSALVALRAGTPVHEVAWVTSAPVANVAIPRAPLDVRLIEDWFGLGSPPGHSPVSGTTGYWVGYQGDVEGVLREGIIRAAEVSIGVVHGGDPDEATRAWPVNVQWKCPNPYFEVWVSWRRHGPGTTEGQVSVLIATPPDKVNRLVTEPRFPPAPPPGIPAQPVPLEAPTEADESQGMWLVAHERHVPHCADQVVDTASGTLTDLLNDEVGALLGFPTGSWAVPMPSTLWHDTGPVVVVAPPSYAGGADPSRSNAS